MAAGPSLAARTTITPTLRRRSHGRAGPPAGLRLDGTAAAAAYCDTVTVTCHRPRRYWSRWPGPDRALRLKLLVAASWHWHSVAAAAPARARGRPGASLRQPELEAAAKARAQTRGKFSVFLVQAPRPDLVGRIMITIRVTIQFASRFG